MARKINVKLIMELRDAGLSQRTIASTTYAESIVERFAHNTTWVETGDVNIRQYLSHA